MNIWIIVQNFLNWLKIKLNFYENSIICCIIIPLDFKGLLFLFYEELLVLYFSAYHKNLTLASRQKLTIVYTFKKSKMSYFTSLSKYVRI